VYAKPVHFTQRIEKASRRPNGQAVHTDGIHMRSSQYLGKGTPDYLRYAAGGEGMLVEDFIQIERQIAARDLAIKRPDEYTTRVNFLNALEKDINTIKSPFKGRRLTGATVYNTQKDSPASGYGKFHEDFPGDNTMVTVLASRGPSPEYSSMRGVVKPPESSLVAHTGFSEHRSPMGIIKHGRVMVAVELEKIPKR
jgi:hypothetical protein